MLPSDRENRAMHMGVEKVTNTDQSLLASPVLPAYSQKSRRVSEGGQGQVPIQEGDGMLLLDEDGNCIYEQPGWCVMHDQNGMVLWNSDRQLCIEQDEVDEDLLAMQTRLAHKQAQDSLVEQNQRLQTELSQVQFAHQTDVERAQELMLQKEAQSQADFRAMVAELEQKKAEFAEERHLALDKCETALHTQQAEGDVMLRTSQAESDTALHRWRATPLFWQNRSKATSSRLCSTQSGWHG